MLADTMRLWVVARMTSNPEYICGGEAIGTVVHDLSSPYYGTMPVPPMVCAHLEIISYSFFLHPLRYKILKALERLLTYNTPGAWFTIYLTLFIVLHSCSYTTKRDEDFGRQINYPVSCCLMVFAKQN